MKPKDWMREEPAWLEGAEEREEQRETKKDEKATGRPFKLYLPQSHINPKFRRFVRKR